MLDRLGARERDCSRAAVFRCQHGERVFDDQAAAK
jgi:hypothetical protein